MELRRYRPEDLPEIVNLFSDSIHHVAIQDYTPQQVRAWALSANDLMGRNTFFMKLYTIVATIDTKIVGYGNIDDSGYLDHLYVHRDYQRLGIASCICDELERHAAQQGISVISVHASKTARSFFEQRGFLLLYENEVQRHGVILINFYMQKQLQKTLES